MGCAQSKGDESKSKDVVQPKKTEEKKDVESKKPSGKKTTGKKTSGKKSGDTKDDAKDEETEKPKKGGSKRTKKPEADKKPAKKTEESSQADESSVEDKKPTKKDSKKPVKEEKKPTKKPDTDEESSADESSKAESSKAESSNVESSKAESSKAEASKDESSKAESSDDESSAESKDEPTEVPSKDVKKDELIVGDVKKSTNDDGKVVLEFTIPQDDHKYIVGKGGENIKNIRNETGADIQLDPSKTKSDTIIITADDEKKANKAKDLVVESVKKVKDQHNDTEESYQQFQKKVDEHARKRQEYFDASKKAHDDGDGKLAKELSEKGKREGELMKEAQKEAARAVFKKRNEGNGNDVIDLHGLQVEPAVEITGEYLDKWAKKSGKYVIITGKGLHSDDKGPKIRPAIEKLLKDRKLKFEDVPGQFEVTV